jgi:uncharacterized protein YdeI (YjbR/CyaY-like superfamily)
MARRRASTSSTFSSASRRGARSIWSKINADKVAALIEAGRKQASGYAQIEAAKADGRARHIAQLVGMLSRGETIHIFKSCAKT